MFLFLKTPTPTRRNFSCSLQESQNLSKQQVVISLRYTCTCILELLDEHIVERHKMSSRLQQRPGTELKFNSLNFCMSTQASRPTSFSRQMQGLLKRKFKSLHSFSPLLLWNFEEVPRMHRMCLMLLILNVYPDLALVQSCCWKVTSLKHLFLYMCGISFAKVFLQLKPFSVSEHKCKWEKWGMIQKEKEIKF